MRMTFEGPAILPGYAYQLRLEAESDLFPEDARFLAHLRTTPSSDQVLAVVASDTGGFMRINDREMDLVLSAEQTATLPLGRVVLDIIRTDLNPLQHLGLFLELPVLQPVTRGILP